MASSKSKLIKKGPNPITKTSPITEKTDSRTNRSDDVYNNLVTLARRGVFVSGGRLPVRALRSTLSSKLKTVLSICTAGGRTSSLEASIRIVHTGLLAAIASGKKRYDHDSAFIHALCKVLTTPENLQELEALANEAGLQPSKAVRSARERELERMLKEKTRECEMLESKLAFFQAMGPELSYPETPCAQLPFHLNPDNWDPDTLGAFELKTEKPEEVKME